MSKTSRTPNKAAARAAPSNPRAAGALSREQRLVAGNALRDQLPRKNHAAWKRPDKRRNVIDILQESNRDRLPELVPIRFGRMLRSPFTFLRGSAGLMAHDLATTPGTGLRVQACGDCHLMNFGLFATPERNLIFDINDFDETLPAPWEWDVKRLAVSFAVAARDSRRVRARVPRAPARVLEQEPAGRVVRAPRHGNPAREGARRRDAQAPPGHGGAGPQAHRRVPVPQGQRRGPRSAPAGRPVEALEGYRQSLPEDRRVLFERYRLEDWAVKVVGIGSVGTRCLVGLFFSSENHPLLLQFMRARASTRTRGSAWSWGSG